ncbi:hypothetical protein MRB53_027558 [Persea americana]|uniref:Uncharacterized protein n=1 Tax=Persea americana TaxID=3435 RepID=A0ACC2LLF3_PERAE|nr:hypothetical protein MRB53_027558 [Persea americana]
MNPHPQSLHANSSETSAVLILSGKAGVSHSRLPFIGCGQQNPESTFQAKDHTRDRLHEEKTRRGRKPRKLLIHTVDPIPAVNTQGAATSKTIINHPTSQQTSNQRKRCLIRCKKNTTKASMLNGKGGYHAASPGNPFAGGRYMAQKKLGWDHFSTV